ncbi:uncharacterized protein LAESUDRAFT_66117 [Laetiporus sulphureus 93-53]|uniref:Uncharacterized protein n=1 Tax=Laetiporus sulphureus 93-53 TaxID=1314785 RepID=A0A165F515_9APHY|nr:uncharacterized protein LAESUDRAFT_66117 [Laetiporus sulphureus 93-53]KZT08406.1 hypothetical protein LAESUDRAFT_66117 [Laetiporus sulphureus 93-53]
MSNRLDGGHAMKSALWSTQRLAGRVDYVHTDDGPSVIADDHSWYAIVTEAEVLDERLDYVYRSRQPKDDDTHPSTTLATPTVEFLTFPSAAAEEDEDDMDHNAWLQPNWSQYMEHLQQLQELYVASTAFPAATVDSASMVNISTSTSTSIDSTPSATAPPLSTSEGKVEPEEKTQTGWTTHDRFFWLGAGLAVLVIVSVELACSEDNPEANSKEKEKKKREEDVTESSSDTSIDGAFLPSTTSTAKSSRSLVTRCHSATPAPETSTLIADPSG